MTFAICLQVPNHLHFKKYLNIYAEFIPQMLFFHSIFGYLVICIIYKWSIDWSTSSTSPPNLLNMLIYMFLSPGTVEAGSQLYTGQAFVQVVLLLTALVCVPWMLCLKPYMLYKEHQRIKGQGYHGLLGQENGNGRSSTDEDLEDEEEGAGQAVSQDAEDDHVRLTISVSHPIWQD
jgi:V-type H+-transporting ATPase subunit a